MDSDTSPNGKSFKVEVQTSGDPKYYSNALRFGTRAEAEIYGADLANRWLAATDWHTAESPDQPNYKIEDGHLVRLEEVSS